MPSVFEETGQGLSKVSRLAHDEVEGGLGARGEAAGCAGDVGQPAFSDKCRGRTSECGQQLRRLAGGDGTGVFTQCHVADTMKAIFYRPVRANDFQQRFGRGAAAGKTGDDANRFDCGFAFERALARQPRDLPRAGKCDERRNAGERFNAPSIDATMPLLDCFSATQVCLARLSLEGEARPLRTHSRSPFEGTSDCL